MGPERGIQGTVQYMAHIFGKDCATPSFIHSVPIVDPGDNVALTFHIWGNMFDYIRGGGRNFQGGVILNGICLSTYTIGRKLPV